MVKNSCYFNKFFSLKIFLFSICLLILISSTSAIQCNQQITKDHNLANNLVCSDTALIINGSHLTLDCQNKQITGKGLGNGIEVIGSAVNIKNCEIAGFENGLVITKASNVKITNSIVKDNLIGANLFLATNILFKDNEITDNSFYGIYSKDSVDIDKDDNIFSNNRQNYYELVTQLDEDKEIISPQVPQREENQKEQDKVSEKEDEKEPENNEFKKPKIDTIISFQTIPLDLPKHQKDKVDALKTVTIKEGKTEYDIEITPKKNFKSIKVTEEIPREVALKSEEIHANIPFKVEQEGTKEHGPVITFDLTDAKQGEKRTVSYSIDREVLSEFVLRPTTFLLLEEAINPGSLWIIRVLFSLTMMLFAISLYLSKTLHRHHHYLIHLSVFIIGIIIFILFNIKVEIVISEFMNNIIMTAILCLLVITLVITNIRYIIMLKSTSKKSREIDDMEF